MIDFLRGDVDITYLERAGARVLSAPPRPGLERAGGCRGVGGG
jgi:hypothetical protein